MTPQLRNIAAFRSLHALCQVQDGKLHAYYYATCLVSGRNPLWAIWNLEGQLIRFLASKQEVADTYPTYAWRKVMAQWGLRDDRPEYAKPDSRRQYLARTYDPPLPPKPEVEHLGDTKVRRLAAKTRSSWTKKDIRS